MADSVAGTWLTSLLLLGILSIAVRSLQSEQWTVLFPFPVAGRGNSSLRRARGTCTRIGVSPQVVCGLRTVACGLYAVACGLCAEAIPANAGIRKEPQADRLRLVN